MRTLWAIGDIQGCGQPLEALLMRLPIESRLIFLGDIINRGAQSLHCLRLVRALCESGRAIALLGNHDLHLLAVASGIRPQHSDDTLAPILNAPDKEALIDWLRHRPLAHYEAGALFVHAGVLPQWTLKQALALAHEVSQHLCAQNYQPFLASMYGNEPARWSDTLKGPDRLRCVINAFTRMRFLDAEGQMNFNLKTAPHTAPATLIPWFDHPYRTTQQTPIVFGHWSTLGFMDRPDAVCLDSGCLWGGALSALSWPDRQRIQVDCPQARDPLAPRAKPKGSPPAPQA